MLPAKHFTGISLNATGIPQTGVQGIPLVQLTSESFMNPILNYSKSNFITAIAAAKQMAIKKFRCYFNGNRSSFKSARYH